MGYKHHKVTGIRKMAWDQLWHVLYEVGGEETWDRVSEKEARSLLNKDGTVKRAARKASKPK